MTFLHQLHDLGDVDRPEQARQADEDARRDPYCTCPHQEDDHLGGEGCVRFLCTCWWWAE